MARYNTALANATINGATTISSPIQGAFTAFTGSAPYTVTLPAPALFPGSNQTFYNATNGTITLSTPSGIFSGTGGSGQTTTSVYLGNVVSVTSDGTNYVVISEDGSILTATTGSFSGDVGISGTLSIGSSGGLTVAPSVQGTINNVSVGATTRASGAFTTLTANNSVSFTANTASSSTGTGTLVVTGGIGVSGQVTATNLAGTLQTAAQPNITSVGTLSSLSITNGGTVAGRYLHYQLNQELGNEGVHQGYLLLAKAYITGNQAISYVKGYFTMTRGSVTSGNKSDIFYVNSQSAYQSDTLLVTGSTNGGFWSRTCKVTYNGVVYHAIETGAGGGNPDNGVFFTGEFTNCSPTFTDARSVSAVTAYGTWNLTDATSGQFFTSGTGGLSVIDTTSWSSGFRNMSSFTMPNITGGGLSIGFGKAGSTYNLAKVVYNHSGDGSSSNYLGLGFWDRDNILSVQASGNVGIGNTNPQYKLDIGYGAGTAAGSGVIKIGGTGGYQSLEFGIKGAYDGMIRTYGNDLHLYAGHWRETATASENHSMFFYTSQNGSSNWSTPKMTLSNVGNLTITGTLTESSSITLKENIEPITGALASVLQLDGKIYDRIDNKEKGEAGLIAEQVFKVLPNLVHVDDEGKPIGVKYTKTVAYLVESIKELYEEIRKLKGQ